MKDDASEMELGEASKIGRKVPEKTATEKLQNLEFEDEIFGSLLESVTFDIQQKEYVHLVNALFAAAKEDIKQERKETKGYKYKLEDSPRPDKYTKGFDAVVDGIFNNMNLDMVQGLKDQDREKFINENKEKFKAGLKAPYAKLKNTLYDVRVFGTGNSNGEKLVKALKICAKVCINVLEPIISIGVIACIPAAVMSGVATPIVIAAPFVMAALAAAGGFGMAGAIHATRKLDEVRATMTDRIMGQRKDEKVLECKVKR
jgi:hypothetical protein